MTLPFQQSGGGGGAAPSGPANEVYATPNGSSGSAVLRALVTTDLPSPTVTSMGGFWGQTISLPVMGASANNITANNKIRLKLFTLPFPTTATGLAIQITTLLSPSTIDVGLYAANVPGYSEGQFVLNTAGATGGGSGLSGATTGVKSSIFSKVTLQAGQYFLAFTGTSTGSITTLGYAAITSEVAAIAISSALTNGSLAWTTTTSATAGILPTGTLGGLATESATDLAPAVFFGS